MSDFQNAIIRSNRLENKEVMEELNVPLNKITEVPKERTIFVVNNCQPNKNILILLNTNQRRSQYF